MNSDSLGDRKGDQFRDAVLAFLSSLSRRERGIDPLEADFRDEFVAEFRIWYARNRYPAVFRASGFRRQARLALGERRLAEAFRGGIAALRTYPEWLLLELKLLPAEREVLEASQFLHAGAKWASNRVIAGETKALMQTPAVNIFAKKAQAGHQGACRLLR